MKNEVKFIIQCYFGDVEDPYLAAIDKAYFDMQTHTVIGNKTDLHEMRFKDTEYLYERIKALPTEKNFDKWHKDTSDAMRNTDSPVTLTYGQIQEWINMTIKYLYTLRSLGVENIDKYFVEHKDEFHAPIDSYVLSAIGRDDISWSKISTYEGYMKIRKRISFGEEYAKWP